MSPIPVVVGTVDLAHADGTPVVNREVLVSERFQGARVQSTAIVGGDERKLTNLQGHAEFTLARGLEVTVAIAGTSLVRDVVVPTDPAITRFDLLDGAVGHDDVFSVQVPNIDYAVRRSL